MHEHTMNGVWTLDEFNTPNGPSYEINSLWDGDDDETRTDNIAEMCMDYRDVELVKSRARLMVSSPKMFEFIQRVNQMADAVREGRMSDEALRQWILNFDHLSVRLILDYVEKGIER